jgi:uncharacterized protein (TIGR03083 family)
MAKRAVSLPYAPQVYLEPLAEEMAGFEALARRSDLTVPVQFSRKWRLSDLVSHLAGIHLWAAATVRKGTRGSNLPRRPPELDLASWYRQCADGLLDTLHSADPGARCWNYGPGPRVAEFWFRRQLHETIIHGRDADMAVGTRREIPAVFAADGVDEVLTVLMPIGGRSGGKPKPRLTGPVLVHATDTGHRWLLTPGQASVPEAVLVGASHPEAASRVRGRAEDLMLLLWGRIPADDAAIRIDGEVEMTTAFLRSRNAL